LGIDSVSYEDVGERWHLLTGDGCCKAVRYYTVYTQTYKNRAAAVNGGIVLSDSFWTNARELSLGNGQAYDTDWGGGLWWWGLGLRMGAARAAWELGLGAARVAWRLGLRMGQPEQPGGWG